MERVTAEDVSAIEAVDGVDLKLMAGGENANVQEFTIAPGATVPEHDHPHEQVGYIVSGELVFLVDGEEIVCGPGDSYALSGGEPHAAENRGDEPVVGIDVFSPPRDDPDWRD